MSAQTPTQTNFIFKVSVSRDLHFVVVIMIEREEESSQWVENGSAGGYSASVCVFAHMHMFVVCFGGFYLGSRVSL